MFQYQQLRVAELSLFQVAEGLTNIYVVPSSEYTSFSDHLLWSIFQSSVLHILHITNHAGPYKQQAVGRPALI